MPVMRFRADFAAPTCRRASFAVVSIIALGALLLALSCSFFNAPSAWASDDKDESAGQAYAAGSLAEEMFETSSHNANQEYTAVLSNDSKGLQLDIYSYIYRNGKYTSIGGTCWYRQWNGSSRFEWKADSEGTLILLPKVVRIEAAPGGVKLPADCSNLFRWTYLYNPGLAVRTGNRFAGLRDIDCSRMDTSNVQSMSGMFPSTLRLTSLDISGWNTSNVTDMSWLFSGCKSLTSLNIANWNTSKATNMTGMFYGCTSLSSLNIANWNTSKVTDMSNMFSDCSALKSLNISKWKTSRVKNSNAMFSGCKALKSVTLPATALKKPIASKKAFTLKWNRPANTSAKMIDGYQIRYSVKSTMKNSKSKRITMAKKTCKLKVGKLKGGKRYYVQIRTFKKTDNNKTYYSAWSKKKVVRVKR